MDGLRAEDVLSCLGVERLRWNLHVLLGRVLRYSRLLHAVHILLVHVVRLERIADRNGRVFGLSIVAVVEMNMVRVALGSHSRASGTCREVGERHATVWTKAALARPPASGEEERENAQWARNLVLARRLWDVSSSAPSYSLHTEGSPIALLGTVVRRE